MYSAAHVFFFLSPVPLLSTCVFRKETNDINMNTFQEWEKKKTMTSKVCAPRPPVSIGTGLLLCLAITINLTISWRTWIRGGVGCGGIARHVPPLQKKFSAPAEFDGYLMGEGAFHLAPSLGGTLLVFSYSHPQSLAHKASLSGFRFYTMSWAPSQHVLSWVRGAGGWSTLRIAGKCNKKKITDLMSVCTVWYPLCCTHYPLWWLSTEKPPFFYPMAAYSAWNAGSNTLFAML